MSDTFELIEEGSDPAEASGRRVRCVLLGCGLLLAFCLLSVFGVLFQYQLRARLASYDTRLTLGAKEDPGRELTEKAAGVLRTRLRHARVLARVRPLGGGEVEVLLDATDLERAKACALRSAELRLQIVVGDEMPADEQAAEIAAIRAARAEGTHDPEAGTFTAYPWHESAWGATPGGWVLLRNEGMIVGSDFSEFGRALDSQGRGSIGFTMSVPGRKKLYALTSSNVDRLLAIVLDGQVRSAPMIRGPIGKKGIIEGGQDGWSDEELRDLLALLDSGALPYRLEVLKEERIGR